MKCDPRTSLLACNLASPYLGGEPKIRVIISSSRKIEKFNRRPNTTSFREFKTTFSTMFMNWSSSINYTEAFVFKQLARYVHYEALDVYK
jgi:hypothetical protein